MAGIGIGPVHAEQIGESGDGDAQVSARIIIGPHIGKSLVILAGDVEPSGEIGDRETQGHNHYISFTGNPITGNYRGGVQVIDGFGYQFHVGLHQSFVPALIEQNPFAIRWLIGKTFGDEVISSGEFRL